MKILEGEKAVFDMLKGIQDLTSQKEEYISKDDMSFAYLLHALTFSYEAIEEESEASHMIMNIISAILLGENNEQSVKAIIGKSLIKH